MPDKEESLATHLEALRSTLIRCLVAVALIFVPAFFAAPYCIDFLTKTLVKSAPVLHYFAPMEVFILQMKVAFVIAILIAFPYIAYHIWKFILPALYENEKKFIRKIVGFSSILFIGGAAFCLFVCFPLVINFGMSFATLNIQPIMGVSQVVSLALWLSIAFGLMFQFPLVTYGLVHSGIVEYKTICNKRPYVLVGILILAAILTPPDVLSQLILATPTYLLFELGLFFARHSR